MKGEQRGKRQKGEKGERERGELRLPEGVVTAPEEFGGGYLYRAGEVLADKQGERLLRESAERLEISARFRRSPVPGTDLVRIRFDRATRDREAVQGEPLVPRLVADVLAHPPEDKFGRLVHFTLAPNHVLYPTLHGIPLPGTPPHPASTTVRALDAPPDGTKLPGRGVIVAVVDSGVREDHPYLAGRAQPLDAGDVEGPAPDAFGFLPSFAGHGTFVAGVVLQHAPAAKVIARRVIEPHGFFDDTQLAEALRSLPEPVHVVNLSLGGYTHDNLSLPATAAALQDLGSRRCPPVVVASAGNDASARPMWPAAFKNVIAVGALDAESAARACFSNFGPWVDACAPGVEVVSAFFEGELNPEPPPFANCLGVTAAGPVPFDGTAVWSGTSFAAPRVAGAIAALTSIGIGADEAAFRLVRATGVRRVRDLGAVVDAPTYD